MKIQKSASYAAIILIINLIGCYGASEDLVKILSISTSLENQNQNQGGSLEGGTTVYIQATGLDQEPTNNLVLLGIYPCEVGDKGVKDFLLSCDTPKPTGPESKLQNLPITIQVPEKPQSICTLKSCEFSYKKEMTPNLFSILPKATYPASFQVWNAKYLVSDTLYIEKMMIGAFRADRFNIIGQQRTKIDRNSDRVTAQVPFDISAGYYTSTLQTDAGYASKTSLMKAYHYKTDQLYDIRQEIKFHILLLRIIPNITSINQNIITTTGTELIIGGLGFGLDPSKVTIKVAGKDASIIQFKDRLITAKVNPDVSYTDGFYLGGNGLYYERYDFTSLGGSIAQFKQKVQTTNELATRLLEKQIYAEPRTEHQFNGVYGQYFRGVFKAHKTTRYRFYCISDDQSAIYIHNTQSIVGTQIAANEGQGLKQIAVEASWGGLGLDDPWFTRRKNPNANPGLVSEWISLTENEERYIEIYHINGGGLGYLSIAMEVETTDNNWHPNSQQQIQKIQFNFPTNKEILRYKVYNSEANILLGGTKTIYDKTSGDLKSDASIEDVVWTLGWHCGYTSPTVVRTPIDNAGNDLPVDATEKAGFKYEITFNRYRGEDIYQIIPTFISSLVGGTAVTEISQIQQPSPPLFGTFTLSFRDTPLQIMVDGALTPNINYDISNSNLAVAIDAYFGTDNVIVRDDGMPARDGRALFVYFRGIEDFENTPLIVANAENLTGGNGIPSITVTVDEPASKNQLYNPIPSEFLYLFHDKPQVVVYVDEIPSVCHKDCSVAYDDINLVTILSYTTTSSTLQITINKPESLILDKFNTRITYAGNSCESIVINVNQITCSFESINNIPILEAGSWKPEILIRDVGFAKYDDAIQSTTIIPTILSVTPNVVSPDGGSEIVIIGTGFPRTHSSGSYSIQFGSVILTDNQIISVSNQQIKCYAPAGTQSVNLIISFNSQTSTPQSFTYDPSLRITITALNIHSASPITKSTIQITGTNFGTIKSDVKVTLVEKNPTIGKPSREYELNINSIINTQITAFLGGGKVGLYDLNVNRKNFGLASVLTDDINDFSYEIVVTNVSPNSGSIGGGTEITVTGLNFKDGDTQVFIGNGVNMSCDIKTISSTQITCIIPPSNGDIAYNSPVQVVVVGRLTEESTTQCGTGNTCTFYYDSSLTAMLNLPELPTTRRTLEESDHFQMISQIHKITATKRFLWTDYTNKQDSNHLKHFFSKRRNLLEATDTSPLFKLEYTVGQSITLTGTGFDNDAKVVIGETIVTPNTQTSTSITFDFPALTLGKYQLRVKNPTKGYALGTWFADIPMIITSISPLTGSKGGQIVTINGQGFLNPKVTLGDIECLEIIVSSSIQLIVRTPQFDNLEGRSFKIIQVNPSTLATDTVASTDLFIPSDTGVPIVSDKLSTVNILTPESFTIGYTGTNLDLPEAAVYLLLGEIKISGANIQTTTNSIQATFTNVPSGIYQLAIKFGDIYAYISDPFLTKVTVQISTFTSTSVQSSFGGGPQITITGSGFSAESIVEVCGFRCLNPTSTFTSIVCQVPPLSNGYIDKAFEKQTMPYLIQPSFYLVKNKNGVVTTLLSDKKIETYNFQNEQCQLDFDFGDNSRLVLHQMRYYPKIGMDSSKFINTKWQASTDGITFTDIQIIDTQFHSGWNFFVPDEPIPSIKVIRFIDQTTLSKCEFAEVEIKGIIRYKEENPITIDTTCGVNVRNSGVFGAELPGIVIYSQEKTPTVTNVTPEYGPTIGGTTLVITGTKFGADSEAVQILIDGVQCIITDIIDTSITCTTGNRDNLFPGYNGEPTFTVIVASQKALVKESFQYANAFSSEDTWGGDIPPREGDTIIVPKGQVLLIDQSTPILYAVIVEGSIIFKDGVDLEFQASYIVVRMGRFQIGTETKPFQSKLTITLHGKISDPQLPAMGNKMIGCHECTLDIHGKVRNLVWTLLAETVEKGTTTITLSQSVDWQVGEEIVIASSEWQHLQSERRIIKSINDKVIEFEEPLQYRHYSEIEQYSYTNFEGEIVQEEIDMRIEVGLLSRNVIIQGDSTSTATNYGAHLMLHGKAEGGLIGRIEYAEFRFGGQPLIIGRYPIHFHMNGEVSQSYVRGNSIHDSMARCITIHGVHFLRVQNNVGYNARGHNIFLEDGIETNNLIENNLIIGSKQRNNRAGGSEWYGVWYEVKSHPDGPSATADICPPQIQIQECRNNTAHSNGRFGLRVFQIHARESPCKGYLPEGRPSFQSEQNNPIVESVFQDFVTWKNNEDGVLGELLGTIKFLNFKVADSKWAGFEAYKTNYSSAGATVENFMIIGKSRNPNPDEYYQNTRGIITPRSDGLHVKNVRFYNFNSDMYLFQSCSQCVSVVIWITGGKTSDFEQIYTTNSDQAKLTYWEGFQREVYVIKDQSLINHQFGSSISAYKKHIVGVTGCEVKGEAESKAIICDSQSTQLKNVMFNKFNPYDQFQGLDMKFYRLNYDESNIEIEKDNQDAFQQEWDVVIMSGDLPESVAAVFATGYTYNVHWRYGIDFTSFGIQPTNYWSEMDLSVVFRFNYTVAREKFEVKRLYEGEFTKTYEELIEKPDPMTCTNGQNYNDKERKLFYLCISGKDKMPYEYVTINGIQCVTNCVVVDPDVPLEIIDKVWSDATIWPNGKLPIDGDSVIVDKSWNLKLDVDTPILSELIVDGNLYFDVNRQLTKLNAKRIWIRYGKISAGDSVNAYQNEIQIEIHGTQADPPLQIDPYIDASNKVLAVTGKLELYGKTDFTVWTRLIAEADAGANQIEVDQADGWAVGDQIIIGPSGLEPSQHEELTITAINGNKINFQPELQFYHYGAPSVTIIKEFGELDMRAAIGYLSRKIKIVGSPGWGARVLIYQFIGENDKPHRGTVQIYGVEFINCGQSDSDKAALDFRYLNQNIYDVLQLPYTNILSSKIFGCSLHDSAGWLLNSMNSDRIVVENNFFYYGVKVLVQMIDGKNNIFKNNLLVAVLVRKAVAFTGYHNWAVFLQFISSKTTNVYSREWIEVSGNVGQGSEDAGFWFMATDCNLSDKNSFFNNQVGSTLSAGIAFRQTNSACVIVQNNGVYHSRVGIQASMASQDIRVRNIISAENKVGVKIKGGFEDQYDNAWDQSNWFVTALARPECIKCYSEQMGQPCRGFLGFQLGAISHAVFPPISFVNSASADTICTVQQLDGRIYMDHIVFDNFKLSYPGLDQCKMNYVFRQHPGAPDAVMGTYLTDTICEHCDDDAKFNFITPTGGLGWFGGCGQMVCTGMRNLLIHDQDGSFLGEKGIVIGDNREFGDSLPECNRKDSWNGYLCNTEEIANLNYYSIAPDYNKRLFSPVTITDGTFTNIINSLKEWSWAGPEPLNLRESKFIAIVKLFKELTITNAGTNPTDAHFFLQKRIRTGNQADWVIIKLKYQTSEALQISVNNEVIKPFPIKEGIAVDLKIHATECGANNYFRETNEIHFVVTGALNCLVRVKQVNTLFLSSRLSIDYSSFFTTQLVPFITVMSGFLGIDPSRMKIVGAKPGSTILDIQIDHDVGIGEKDDNSQPYDPSKATADLTALSQRFKEGLANPDLLTYSGEVMKEELNIVTDFDKWESTDQPTQEEKSFVNDLKKIEDTRTSQIINNENKNNNNNNNNIEDSDGNENKNYGIMILMGLCSSILMII